MVNNHSMLTMEMEIFLYSTVTVKYVFNPFTDQIILGLFIILFSQNVKFN